jgi:hypothetical protein
MATVPLFDSWGLKWVRGRDCVSIEQLIGSIPGGDSASDAEATGDGGGEGDALEPAATAATGRLLTEPATPVIVVRKIIAELVRAEPTYF